MNSWPPTGMDPGSGSASMSSAEFEQALRDAAASMQTHGFGPRTAVIPDLRRALGGRVSRQEFDQELRRLQQGAIVELTPHAHPELLSASKDQDALHDGGSVLYLLRWLK